MKYTTFIFRCVVSQTGTTEGVTRRTWPIQLSLVFQIEQTPRQRAGYGHAATTATVADAEISLSARSVSVASNRMPMP